MTTTGISVGSSLGKSPRVTNIGFNQDDRDKQGITRNTVVGNVEIGEASGNPINRDVTKANEVTKDVHHSTNVNVESQTIEYATNPTKFKEDLEVAILEGKATGETVLKTIENLVNGGKEDIGDPERRSLNEIKEAVIRVKTAPEMNLIATGDLNSQEVLNTLKINGIEKFNPDDPDLPENVRARLDEVRKSGGEIEAFYDKTTNKIFINENVEDGETRALVAREWKISEDLKDGKGKANDEGQLKATVAGELAYDDMMKRAGEGKTGSISTDDLNVGVMDENSEITADFNNKHVDKFLGRVGSIWNKVRKGDFKGAYKEAKQTKQDVTRVLNNDIKTVLKGGPAAKRTINESANATVYAVKKIVTKSSDKNKSSSKSPKSKKKTTASKPKTKSTSKPKNNDKPSIGERLQKVASGAYDVIVGAGTSTIGAGLIGASGVTEAGSFGISTPLSIGMAAAGGVAATVGGNKVISGTAKVWDGVFGNAKQVRGESLNPLRAGTKAITGHPEYYDDFETLVEVGAYSTEPYISVLGNASKLSRYNAEYKRNNVIRMTKEESAIAKQGAIYLEEKNGVWVATNNATPSIFESKPALLSNIPTSKISTSNNLAPILAIQKMNTPVRGSHKPATKELPRPVVKITGTKKTTHVTGKSPTKPSFTGKVTSRIIVTDSSKGKETEIRNIGDFATIKIEKTNLEIPPAYMIDGMTKGGKEKTSRIGNGSYLENYGGGKASDEVPPFANRENIHRNNSTQNYEFKSQNNGSNGSNSGGGSGSKKSIEPPVKDNSKIYTLESQNANWNFNSEIPRTAVKNSEGNYTLGRGNEWSVNNTVTSVKRISENQNNIYNVELNNGMTPGYTLIRKSDIKVNIDENEVNKHLEVSKIVKGDIYGGHTIDSVDHIFTNSYTKDPYNPEYKIVSFEEKYPGIYQLEYKAPARTSAGEVVKNEGKIRYKNKILNKTVFDSEIYKTEELTKEVTKEVKRVITQDDVTRAFQNVEKQVSLDIKINNIKVRVYIKANEKTGGVEIKNYHFDVQE